MTDLKKSTGMRCPECCATDSAECTKADCPAKHPGLTLPAADAAQPPKAPPLGFELVEDCMPDHGSYGLPDGSISVSAQWCHEFAANVAAKSAAQPQQVVLDEVIERLALKHVAPQFGMIGPPGDYKDTEQFRRLKAFTLDLLASAPPAPQKAEAPRLEDIEQYRMQMAGICTAAIGYWKEGDGIHPDYDTVALRDVAKLYAKYDELYRTQPAAAEVRKQALDSERLDYLDKYAVIARPGQSVRAAIDAARALSDKKGGDC